MEFHKKRRDLNNAAVLREHDRGRTYYDQRDLHHQIDLRLHGTRMALRDAEPLKRGCEDQFVIGDFTRTRALIIELSITPDLVCSAAVGPECDFTGTRLQDLDTTARLDYICCSVIPTATGGAFVLSWLDPAPASEALARSLSSVPDSEIADAIVRFCFEFFENIYFRPSWWTGLPEPARDSLLGRFRATVNSGAPRADSCLLDDGLRTAVWPVTMRHALY